MTSLGRLRVVMIAAAVVVAGLGGVAIWLLSDEGGDGDDDAAPAETADPLPRLPPEWSKTVNQAGGFAIGVPPGWTKRREGPRTTLRSPVSSVVVAITADRSEDALDQDLDAYALGIAERLEPAAEQRPLQPLPESGDPDYETAGAVVIDTGASEGGAKRLEVIVVRRRDLAAYPLLIASDSAVKPAELNPLAAKLVRSLRGRPPR